MRPVTKLKIARRQHTLELLKWLYSRREKQLDGTKLSLQHRRSEGGGVDRTRSLTYGEIDVPDFLSILDLVQPAEGEIFVDLGSGTGKAVLAASCGFPEFSKCRGIELVQGLADAAADHLRTAKAFLANPRAPSDIADSTTGEISSAAIVGAPHGVEKVVRGGGGVRGRKAPSNKAAQQGLSAVDLEGLIAELLSRKLFLPREPDSGETSRDGVAARGGLEATAEEVASWVVKEVGHRRYKQSLRGYGGLQKFLVARRGASDTSNRLDIAEDGATVSIATTEDVSSSQQEECVTDDRGKEGRTSGGVSVQQGSSVGVLGIGAGAAPAASADTVLSIDGTLVPPATCVAVAAASLSLNPSFPHLSCKEPFAKDNGPPATLATEGYSVGYKNRKGRSGGGGTADRKRLPEPGPLSIESLSGVDLLCGDIFQEPWNDAGVVYVASLLFDDSMMVLLAKSIQNLKKGARVISLRPIPALETSGEVLRILHEGVFRMSWQMARVYIYLRL